MRPTSAASAPLRHSVHDGIEPLLAHRVWVFVLVLLGKLLELAALEGFLEVHVLGAALMSTRACSAIELYASNVAVLNRRFISPVVAMTWVN